MNTDLSVGQAAEVLGVNPKTVYRRIARGQLSARKVEGDWRIDLSKYEGKKAKKAHEPDQSADLVRALTVERDWLRGLVEQLTAINTDLASALRGGGPCVPTTRST